MQNRVFPATGQAVSEIGLGTWQLGGTEWGAVSDSEAQATLAAAVDRGVTFFDTADIYGAGRSETRIGRFLRDSGQRDRLFIATKLGRRPDPGWPENFTPAVIRRHTEESLRRLGIERLDLTQTHCLPGDVLKQGAIWETLRELQACGKIRAFGASVESVEEGYECLQVPGLGSLQIILNVFRQRPLEGLLEAAARRGVAIIARLPLASGLLSGQLRPETSFPADDHRHFNRDGQQFNVGETFAGLKLETGLELVEQLRGWVPPGVEMAAWALRWCLDWPQVTTLIPGARKPHQIQQNASASSLPPISPEHHDQLRLWYRQEVAPNIRGKY